MRYRHTDSDFVRVARQQDFLRDLREQIDPSNELGQIDKVAKAVGHAITSTFPASPEELILLTKLIAFSQTKPLRQVRFLTTNVNAQFNGGSYVTSTPELEKRTLDTFLNGHEQLKLPRTPHGSRLQAQPRSPPQERGLLAGGAEPVPDVFRRRQRSGQGRPGRALPRALPDPADRPGRTADGARLLSSKNQQNILHHAYVVVWRENSLGGYYDFEGTDWLNPPLFAHARTQVIDGRSYEFVDDGSHIHVIGWRSGRVLYWLTNTLLEELSNSQMLAIAKSAQSLH